MRRREAVKQMVLGLGYAVSAPTVLSMLESCSENRQTWEAKFLSPEQRQMVHHLVEIILPKSDTPGGLDLNLPQFVDMMCADVLTAEDQELFNSGTRVFAKKNATLNSRSLEESGETEIRNTFSAYFDLPEDEKSKILSGMRKGSSAFRDDIEKYAVYRCLFTIREFTLLGYFTSENIGKEILNFDPIPGGYEPCIPLDEVGKVWTIS